MHYQWKWGGVMETLDWQLRENGCFFHGSLCFGSGFLRHDLLGWRICRTKLHERFCLNDKISHEKCSETVPEILEPLFCGSEKTPKIRTKFPAKFPPKNQKNSPTSFCRSAGRTICHSVMLNGNAGRKETTDQLASATNSSVLSKSGPQSKESADQLTNGSIL